MGQPMLYRVTRADGLFLETMNVESARAFKRRAQDDNASYRIDKRPALPGDETVDDKRPITRRFVIKRHPTTFSTRSPWVLRDRSRPTYLGHFGTHTLALAAVDRKLAEERGYVPSVAEIREAMSA